MGVARHHPDHRNLFFHDITRLNRHLVLTHLPDDQIAPATAHQIDPFGKGGGAARHFDHDIRPAPTREVANHTAPLARIGDILNVNRVRRTPFFRYHQAIRRCANHHHLMGAGSNGHRRRVQPERSRPLHHHCFIIFNASQPVECVHHRAQGTTGRRRQFARHAIGHLDAAGGGKDVAIFGKAPHQIRRFFTVGEHIHAAIRAQGRLMRHRAHIALATRPMRPHQAIAFLQGLTGGIGLDPRAHAHHAAHHLVPQNNGQRNT